MPNGATSPNAKALLAAAKVLQGKSSEEEEKKLRRMSLKDEVRRLIIKQKAMKKLNKKTSASIKESPSVSDEDAMAAASSPKVGIFARQNSFSRLSNKSNSKGANNKFSSRRRDSRMMSVVGYNGESAHHRRPTMEILDETKEVALTTQQKLSMLVEHPVVTTLILLVTILAISLLFLQLFDVQQAQNDETRNNIAIYWIEWAILIFFTVEVVVRFIAMGADYLKDFLCLMDLAVSIVDWATVLLSTTGLDAFVFLRVLRVLRLTKVTRMARLSTYYNQNEDNFHEDETGRIYSYNADHLFSVGYATRFAGTVSEGD